MQSLRIKSVLILIVLSMMTLACRFSFELPWNPGVPDVEISPEDVSVAATRAAVAAAAAASVADQAAQLAATAVLQGDGILSTAVAGESLPGLGAAAGIAGSLQEKLTNINVGADGKFTITLTDADLAEYISTQGGSFENAEARIENVQVNLLPQHVVVAGDLTSPVALPLHVELRPVVVDGRLQFQVINATAGLFPVPSSLLSTLEAGVNAGLGQLMNQLPAGISLLDVALGNGSMTVLGQKN